MARPRKKRELSTDRQAMADRAALMRTARCGDDQIKFATEVLGISYAQWNQCETGERPFSYDIETRLKMALPGMSLDYIRFGETDKLTGWSAEHFAL